MRCVTGFLNADLLFIICLQVQNRGVYNRRIAVFNAFDIAVNGVSFFKFVKFLYIVGIQNCHVTFDGDRVSFFHMETVVAAVTGDFGFYGAAI